MRLIDTRPYGVPKHASAIIALGGYQKPHKLASETSKKEVYFPNYTRLFGQNLEVSLAKMAAINCPVGRTDKPARRIPLMPVFFSLEEQKTFQ
jgi:hypothetical protein